MTTEPQTKTKKRTMPKEVRRAQLIEATLACIAELGISKTTMAAVTGRAGLSMGIVSLHFESKDNLLNETLVHLSEEVRSTWAEAVDAPDKSAAEKLRALSLSSFHPSIFDATKLRVWFAFFGEAKSRAYYREMVSSYDNERGHIAKALCAELLQDYPEASMSAEEISDALEFFSDGIWLNAMLYPEYFKEGHAALQMEQMLAAYFPKHFQLPLRPAPACTQ
ncbi:MAG: TetR family transcriptional regulator C-terminal domain-containing protein [Pseudomonadota bacterium]